MPAETEVCFENISAGVEGNSHVWYHAMRSYLIKMTWNILYPRLLKGHGNSFSTSSENAAYQ